MRLSNRKRSVVQASSWCSKMICKKFVSALFGRAPFDDFRSTTSLLSSAYTVETTFNMVSSASTLRSITTWTRLLRHTRLPKPCLRCLSTVPATTTPAWHPPPLPPTRSPYQVTQGRTHERTFSLLLPPFPLYLKCLHTYTANMPLPSQPPNA